MIYRALVALDTGKAVIGKGAIFPESRLSPHAKRILEEQGKIAPAILPPLAAMPTMRAKALRLARINIVSVGEFLEADDAEIAKTLRISEKAVRLDKEQLYTFFTPSKPG